LTLRSPWRTLAAGGTIMNIINATEARSKLYRLIDETAETHEPIVITGKRKNAVLLSEEDWDAISETIYLLSIPEMRESIREGLEENISDCSKDLDW
jgi:antitoxin YefM